MSAIDALHLGDLGAALADLQNTVRAAPEVSRHRVFLFQLLSVLGQWPRALTQLDVIAELDAGALPMTQAYREVIKCELLRAEIFAGKRSPLILGDPEQWLAELIESLRLSAQGEYAAAMPLRDSALAAAPATPGTIFRHAPKNNEEAAADLLPGEPFEWLADADSRLGPVLEAVVNGRYYWIALHHIARIDLERPTDLRDVVWTPAHFEWANGGQVVGMIPTRYVSSELQADDALKLSRKTEWIEDAPDFFRGLGQRMLTTDTADYALMDVGRIEFLQSADKSTDE